MCCENCGRTSARLNHRKRFGGALLCDSCFISFKKYPFEYFPPKGEIHYNADGKIICHVCGRAFDILTYHIEKVHKISQSEYKEKYGLNRGARLTSKRIQIEYKNHPTVDIATVRKTFKSGHTHSKKSRRLQTIKDRTGAKYNVKKEECK